MPAGSDADSGERRVQGPLSRLAPRGTCAPVYRLDAAVGRLRAWAAGPCTAVEAELLSLSTTEMVVEENC